jgi:uncharacterized SAM-binding protein YcdF (DUF218 family)
MSWSILPATTGWCVSKTDLAKMFVFLSKLLPLFVYPLGLGFVLLCMALFLGRGPGRRAAWQRMVLVAALVCLGLGSNRWVSLALARSLEWRYLPPQPVPEAGAIVVLGGGTVSPEAPRPIVEMDGAGDRVIYAAQLYKQGKAPHILVSGGVLDWTEGESTPAADMVALLEMMGVPGEAIWQQTQSRNTYEDALYSARILKEKGISRILLVTSASHMPRSVNLFAAQGLETIPAPVDFTVSYAEWRGLFQGNWQAQVLNLLPSVDALGLTTRILKEYLGMLVYDWKGWY